ncbi:unnamed protein product [Prunus brigantina]
MPSRGPMNPPSIPKVSVASDKEDSASVEKQEVEVGPEFFYKLIDDTEWISSRHLDMATFLIRKRQLSHPLPCYIHCFICFRFSLCNMPKFQCLQQFLERYVQEVKQNGMKMSTFTPFTVCSIGDVPQHRDGTSCEILTFKFIEYLSAGISLDKVDPLKIKYYRLKLAIEDLRGEAYI